MNWSFDLPLATIHRICGDRIVTRGENHQTLRADADGKSHEEVIWMFLQTSEELLDGEVDESIEMDVEESLEDALARAVEGCVRILGVPRPSVERIGQALAAARGYAPATKREMNEKQKQKAKANPRYYALVPEVDVEKVLKKRMKADDVPQSGRDFYRLLTANERITDRPHITLVHEKGLPEDKDLWERCKAIFAMPTPPVFTFKLEHVVWNDRVMAITVSDVAVSKEHQDPETKGVEFIVNLPQELQERLHVTVGTKSKDVPPVEAKDLVASWKKREAGIQSCALDELWVKGSIKGLFS
jgi:tRNA ligase